MSLKIKQLLPCEMCLVYYQDWVLDSESETYQAVKVADEEEIDRGIFFWFEIVKINLVALAEKGAVQFICPVDFDPNVGGLVPVVTEDDPRVAYIDYSGNFLEVKDDFIDKILAKIRTNER